MSAVKKDCARSLYNAIVLSHPERSGLDKFMLLIGKIEKNKSKNALEQKPIEH